MPKRGKKKPGTIQSQQRLGMLVQKVGKADPPDYTKVSASLRSAKQRGPVKRLLAQDETARVQAPVDVSIFTKGGNSFENSEKAIRKRAKNAQRNLSRSAGRSIGNAYKAKLGLSLGQLFEDYVTPPQESKNPAIKILIISRRRVNSKTLSTSGSGHIPISNYPLTRQMLEMLFVKALIKNALIGQ